GSLPGPASLTRLYARRSRGEAVSAAELAAEGGAALRRVVAKQIDARIDVANKGEQQRESFVLYVRDRLSGLGGTWQRRQRADVERYPAFKQIAFGAVGKEAVDDIAGLTRARGEVRYLDAGAILGECADFRATLQESKAAFAETFLTAPSPGMVSAIVLNEYYPTEEAFLGARGAAGRVRDHHCQWFPASARLPRSGARAPQHLPGSAARGFPRLWQPRHRCHQSCPAQCSTRAGAHARLLGQL